MATFARDESAMCKVMKTESMGRSLVMSRDVAQGAELLRAEATGRCAVLLDSAMRSGQYCAICMSHSKSVALMSCNANKCIAHLCQVCSSTSEILSVHDAECGEASSASATVRCLLRLLAAEKTEGHKLARELSKLEDHLDEFGEERQNAFLSSANQALELHFKKMNIHEEKSSSSSQGMYVTDKALGRWKKIAAAFESNEFGISKPNSWQPESAIMLGEAAIGNGLFVGGAFANHSCHPNAAYSVEIIPGHIPQLVLRNTRALRTGEHVFISYVPLYSPVEQRQADLFDMYRFVCNCNRCKSEQTEGTPEALISASLNGFLCNTCRMGLVFPPLTYDSDGSEGGASSAREDGGDISDCGWECRNCQTIQTVSRHLETVRKLEELIMSVQQRLHEEGLDKREYVKISESLNRNAIAASPYLHHFHILLHTIRVFRFGLAMLTRQAVDISLTAICAQAPLQETQQREEFAYWIAILNVFSNYRKHAASNSVTYSLLVSFVGEAAADSMLQTAKEIFDQSKSQQVIGSAASKNNKKRRSKKKRRRY